MRHETVPIEDPDDPRIADYRAVRERDLVGRAGLFVAEGDVVVGVLVRQRRFRVQSILVSERRIESVRTLIDQAPLGTPLFVARQDVMDAITGFHIHRGLLAIGVRGDDPPAEQLIGGLPALARVLCLVGISNHDNVGGIFRNAAAFGVGAVLIDRDTCDPLYRKAIRVSVGASLIVPFARVSGGAAMLALLAGAGVPAIGLTPAGREPLEAVADLPRAALFLGAEGPGLPDDLLMAMRTVRIDMAAGFDSLNVATTSGIALHALRQIYGTG